MKIYTKKGDDGQTSLFGGKRVSKDNIRIESYGTVDELNSFIGLVADIIESTEKSNFLRIIQSRLFDIGAQLSSTTKMLDKVPGISLSEIEDIEIEIDKMEESLPKLTNFILPGGHLIISYCHISRTICRRAERRCISLANIEEVNPTVIKYLNRLSDYLFVLSRWVGHENNIEEIKWIAKK